MMSLAHFCAEAVRFAKAPRVICPIKLHLVYDVLRPAQSIQVFAQFITTCAIYLIFFIGLNIIQLH